MALPTTSVYIRTKRPDGTRPFLPAFYDKNHQIKPGFADVDGQPVPCAGSYYLRYGSGSKQVWELVKDGAGGVSEARRKRNALLNGHPATELSPPEPVADSPSGRPLDASVAEYLGETAQFKSHKTWLAYSLALRGFQDSCGQPVESIKRADVMRWMGGMKEAGFDIRTISNRICSLRTFIRHFEQPWPLKYKDMPHPVDKPPVPYSEQDLAKLLAAATVDEGDLLTFFLGTGAREQEAQFATWRDISFELGLFYITVKDDRELRWVPKDKQQGEIPIPEDLVARLQARRLRYPKTRLIFATPGGKPDGHLLRGIKRLALRAGANCGECLDKKGRSCSTHPVCRRAILHRFRKSFAFLHSEAGVNVRTIQDWLRHADLGTTQGYLAASDNQSPVIRAKVNSAFAAVTKLSPPVVIAPVVIRPDISEAEYQAALDLHHVTKYDLRDFNPLNLTGTWRSKRDSILARLQIHDAQLMKHAIHCYCGHVNKVYRASKSNKVYASKTILDEHVIPCPNGCGVAVRCRCSDCTTSRHPDHDHKDGCHAYHTDYPAPMATKLSPPVVIAPAPKKRKAQPDISEEEYQAFLTDLEYAEEVDDPAFHEYPTIGRISYSVAFLGDDGYIHTWQMWGDEGGKYVHETDGGHDLRLSSMKGTRRAKVAKLEEYRAASEKWCEDQDNELISTGDIECYPGEECTWLSPERRAAINAMGGYQFHEDGTRTEKQ
jgi:integrase/recombinase XerD